MIPNFKEEPYTFLSNMHPCEISITADGRVYQFGSVEAAYQAGKFTDPEIRKQFEGISGYEAKRLAKTFPIDLERHYKRRVIFMRSLLDMKFAFGSELAERLLETCDEELVEGNTWGDTFWGVYNGVGENYLGRLLMERREELLDMWGESFCG